MRRMSGGKEGESRIKEAGRTSSAEAASGLYKTKPISGRTGKASMEETGGCDCNDEIVGV
jgi:hypothetical protein